MVDQKKVKYIRFGKAYLNPEHVMFFDVRQSMKDMHYYPIAKTIDGTEHMPEMEFFRQRYKAYKFLNQFIEEFNSNA